jgi:hypothetical protein
MLEGGEADPQSRPAPGARRPRRLEKHSGGIGRDPHAEQARIASRAAPLARLHQHHREHDGHGASRHPQREALEFALDGLALDCCGHARSQEGLSQAKSLQATSGLTSRACCSLRKGNKQPRCCPKGEGRLTSFTAAPASPSSTKNGATPAIPSNRFRSRCANPVPPPDRIADRRRARYDRLRAGS